ncbi:peripheral plasma membrane protein CASK isoform X1 [Nematostella vectensis]|uniref:peripheral plasma membrane protein CASK isoform X1 n=1 Tax=Nematostella vectensis TaxID=45351 RepID=UPI00207766C0|nr:peripheral plasma membrane protein CASK isoform X1 [Nematostella vectensis]XP_032236090.2 peripheral plasma membrane protein CASK isoform X1 [Nematostella vectensis]
MENGFPLRFDLQEQIGKGTFSVIKKCTDKKTNRVCAVKIVDVSKMRASSGLTEEDLNREAYICQKLTHPHIVEMMGAYSMDGYIYMVFEYMDGADLCFEIVNRVNAGFVYSEAVASHYMRQVLEAVSFCHENGIIHRDLKPHNVLLANRENSAPIKVADFGVAVELPPEGCITSGRLGTPHFMSPEVVNRQPYGKPVDVWGCGIILFILLSGNYPFHGTGEKVYQSITKGQPVMRPRQWDQITDEAKDLCLNMLATDQDQRISAADALQHPWLKNREVPNRNHLQETVDELKKFNARRKLKGAVLAAVASRKFPVVNGIDVGTKNDDDVFECEDSDLSATGAIGQLLDSLEEIQLLTGARKAETDFLQTFFEDRHFQALLEVYDRSQEWTETHESCPPFTTSEAEQNAKDVVNLIEFRAEDDDDCYELQNILCDPHVMAMLQAHDGVLQEEKQDETSILPPDTTPNDTIDNSIPERPEKLTRVRLVQFHKNPNEPMGITLKLNDEGRCVVARIMYGGMIHRQGTLHPGDEIREINGSNVADKSIEALQSMLRDASGNVTFKIVPSSRGLGTNTDVFVRALFDYDPRSDDLIPCQRAGMAFHCSEILQVVNKADCYWWQAKKPDANEEFAGLIPSPELQEWRVACIAAEKSKKQNGASCIWFSRKKKTYRDRYVAKHNAVFDRLDLVTYEEVVKMEKFKRKTLVLLGAHGVGRRHIKNTLINKFADKFAYPIPHTTRDPRAGEEDGKHYYFVSAEVMMSDIESNRYLEYGTHEGAMYGTKLDTITDIIENHKVAILDVEPQALKILRTAKFTPYVVFISAPSIKGINDIRPPVANHEPAEDAGESLKRLAKESDQLRQTYGHLFDLTIVNNDIDETIAQLEEALERLGTTPQWVPISWIY